MYAKNFSRTLSCVFLAFACTSALAIPPPPPAPELEDLANASYQGLLDVKGVITLTDGQWQGEPYVEGGASAPAAHLVGNLVVQGDLDFDGRTESINLVNYSAGGTGQFVYLAVSRFAENGVENFETVLLGDRVMVRDLRIDNGVVVVDMIQAGPNDGACCPGELVTKAWRLQDNKLEEAPMNVATGRFSVETIAGVEWILSRWGHDEPVEDGIRITLSYADGRFTGNSTCNRYFAGVGGAGEDIAGSISVTGVGSTRMACVEERFATAEDRFFKALEQVGRITFLAGEMALNWGQGTDFGALYFKRAEPGGD